MEGKVSVVLVLLPGTATSVDGTAAVVRGRVSNEGWGVMAADVSGDDGEGVGVTGGSDENGRSRFVFCTLELRGGGVS